MLQEWSDKQFKTVKQIIKSLFLMKRLTDHRGTTYFMRDYESIENFFGLAYTSSSSCAMLGCASSEYCLDTENKCIIEFFALGKDNKVYIFCTDADENETVYQVL